MKSDNSGTCPCDLSLNLLKDGAIRILQFADIQIIDSAQQRYTGRLSPESEKYWATGKMYERAWRFMREAVSKTKPDLIVLSGDNIYGEFDDKGSSLDALIKEMDSYSIPWTLTFGNHDNETAKGIKWTCERYSSAKNCLFTRGDTDILEGNGNFSIAVYNRGELTATVFMMDSHGQTDADITQNLYASAGIYPKQKEWFKNTNEKILKYTGGKVPVGTGFCHHPFSALGKAVNERYGYVSERNGFKGADGKTNKFLPIKVPENPYGDFGAAYKDVGGFIDRDMSFHKLLKKYGFSGWFFGHDHEINLSAEYNGIRYTFGLKTGQYDSFVEGELGSTLIEIKNGELKVSHIYSDYK